MQPPNWFKNRFIQTDRAQIIYITLYNMILLISHQVPSGESISEAISNVVQLLSNAGHTIIPISYKLNDYFKHHDIMASRLTVFDVANSAWMYRSTGRTLLNCRKIHDTRCSAFE